MPATVTIKGQITLPKAIRERLGIVPGSRVDFHLNDRGEVVVEKEGEKPKSRFDALRGTLKDGIRTDDFMKQMRGEDD